MPATTKVLSILDRSVRDRVTKNGECLRRHAEARARWKNLRERINRIDAEMEQVRVYLVNKDKEPEPSDAGSALSRVTSKSNYLSTPSTRSRTGSSSTSALARSMSPLRRFASKVSSSVRSAGRDTPSNSASSSVVSFPPVKPLNLSSSNSSKYSTFRPKLPPKSPHRPVANKIEDTADPEQFARKKESVFPFLTRPPPTPSSRPGTAGSSGRAPSRQSMSGDVQPLKPKWNASTKVEETAQSATIKASPRRPSISSGNPFRPTTPSTPGSRPPSSMARHNASTSLSVPTSPPVIPPRSLSRSGARTPSNQYYTTPRSRPQTPSSIPGPNLRSAIGGNGRSPSPTDSEPPTSLMQRALSPNGTTSPTRALSPTDSSRMTPVARQRRPSNSMIPVPKMNLNPGSRPGSSLSRSASPAYSYEGAPSPAPGSRFGARSQTPESMLRARALQMPIYMGAPGGSPESIDKSPPRPPSATPSRVSISRQNSNLSAPSSFPGMARTLVSGLGSSFRRAVEPKSPTSGSRPGSRATDYGGTTTPSLEGPPANVYVPTKTDELDMEVARVVNGMAHGFL